MVEIYLHIHDTLSWSCKRRAVMITDQKALVSINSLLCKLEQQTMNPLADMSHVIVLRGYWEMQHSFKTENYHNAKSRFKSVLKNDEVSFFGHDVFIHSSCQNIALLFISNLLH